MLAGGTQPVDDAIQQAYTSGRNGKGLAMFFSSGNDNDSTGTIWPSSLSQTIAVNATSMCDQRKNPNDCSGEDWGGDYGSNLDFSAPGVKITTTDMRGSYGFSSSAYTFTFNGTSASCPNAAAVGALLLSIRPDLNPEDVRHIIAVTCDKVGGYAYDSILAYGTWSKELGYGRVNAYRAVQYALTYSSIKGIDKTIALNIFPNPSTGMINVQYSNSKDGVLKMYDLEGKELLQTKLQQGENTLDASALSSGIYLVIIAAESGTITRKVIISR